MSAIQSDLQGYLAELRHDSSGEVVEYSLPIGDERLALNAWIGRPITLVATGKKACVHCGRSVKKLFASGYCYPCFSTLAECDLCIVKPHECHFHRGTCRDESFGTTHCMIPHYVYLAFSSAVKVGLTRKGRQRTRWVDQGAQSAILLAELPTRKEAGEFEMEVAAFMPDKTDWRKMLARLDEADSSIQLPAVKQSVIAQISEARRGFVLHEENTVHAFRYPVLPDAKAVLKSLSFDKTASITGQFIGIKGQYLLLDCGVLNIKKHSGYEIRLTTSAEPDTSMAHSG